MDEIPNSGTKVFIILQKHSSFTIFKNYFILIYFNFGGGVTNDIE